MATCAVPACAARIAADKLMCKEHWYTVPHRLRQAINRHWRSIQSCRNGRELGLIRRDYDAAVAKSIEAVEALLP